MGMVITELGNAEDWRFVRAEKTAEDGNVEFRWVASKRRVFNEESPDGTWWQTDVILRVENDDVAAYGVRIEKGDSVGEKGRPDPFPTWVVMMLAGFKTTFLEQGQGQAQSPIVGIDGKPVAGVN